MNYTGAIFDMDGVLFDTERIYQETWQELAEKRHIMLNPSFLKAICGSSGDHMRHIIEEYYQVQDGTAIIEECMIMVRKKLAVHVPVKEGVVEILSLFRQNGIPTAIASSTARKQIESNLNVSGLSEYFTEIVSGTEVAHGKPAPDVFLLAAKKIGCKPQECFVFEDSENGVRAGHAAGCMTIMVPDLIEPSPQVQPFCYKICRSLTQARNEIEAMGGPSCHRKSCS